MGGLLASMIPMLKPRGKRKARQNNREQCTSEDSMFTSRGNRWGTANGLAA